MRSVGLKVLKIKLSEYVRLAERGEIVLVTDRHRVVAELVPPRDTRIPILADVLLADLVRQGLLAPALMHDTAPAARKPVVKWAALYEELDADRGDL